MGPLAALSVFLNLHSTDVDLQALRADECLSAEGWWMGGGGSPSWNACAHLL